MFSTLRTRFGIPGVISVIALVFAMLGGAYAANNSSSGGKATASAKKAKAKKGPRGPRGPKGPKGDTGPAGPQGAKGDTGAEGKQGPQGATGANGATGSPWPAGGTLPPGATQTGVWGGGGEIGEEYLYYPINFFIPTATAPEAVFVGPEDESEPGCPGRGGGEFPATGKFKPTIPQADPGKLCVYADVMSESEFEAFKTSEFVAGSGWSFESGVSQTGTILQILCKFKFCVGAGTWAVTAPTAP
ncbi:MAG TPA: hypothetical protein VG898_10950 [Solirubrobacterales bacterium]|nr:hypothetical protein [Solirubrobacterales bacterium]